MARPCPNCGRENPSAAVFCGACGGRLPAAAAQPPLPPTPRQQPYQQPQYQPQQPPVPQMPPMERPPPKKQLGGCGCFVLFVIIMMILAASVSVMRSKTYMQNLQPTPQNIIPVPPGGFRPAQTNDPRGEIAARALKIDPKSFRDQFRIVNAERTATGYRTTRDDRRRANTTVITLHVTALRDLNFTGTHFVVADVRDEDHSVPSAVHANPDGQPVDRWRNGQSGQIIVCIDEYAYSTASLFQLRLQSGNASYPRLTALR